MPWQLQLTDHLLHWAPVWAAEALVWAVVFYVAAAIWWRRRRSY